jgi:integrase
VVDLGPGIYRRCPECRRAYWLRDGAADACKRCKVTLGPEESGRRQKWLSGFATKQAAKDARDAARVHVKEQTYVTPTDETVAEYLRAWLRAQKKLRQTTARNYSVNIEKYVVPQIGALKLTDVTSDTLDALYDKLSASGSRTGGPLAPKTVRNVHLVLHKALASAVKKRRLKFNPASACDAVPALEERQAREQRMREEVWSPAEIRTFLESVRDDRLYAAWLLLATTGLRRGELLGLGWQHVDLETGTIRVARSLVVLDGKPTLTGTTKTDSSAATIAVDAGTVAALRAHRTKQKQEERWGEEAYAPSDLVFTAEAGGPLSPTGFLRRFQRLARHAGLRPIRVHAMRHSYASALLAGGLPMKVISDRLRHAGIGITSDLYVHLSAELDKASAEAGAAFILGS